MSWAARERRFARRAGALGRAIAVLSLTFVGLLSVVIVRAEVTRLHYRVARVEREIRVAKQELRDRELVWSRLRSPARIQDETRQLQLRATQSRGDS